MKVHLIFNLPEEREEYQMAMKGGAYHASLIDIMDYFRRKIKYEELPDKEAKIYEKIRDDIVEILEDNEVLNDLP